MIIIDAGHGGLDSGGGSNVYWKEKNFALLISLYQYYRLKSLGANVALTRDNDITLIPKERIDVINRIKTIDENDLIISNHINIDFGNFSGAEIIYSINKDSTLPKIIAKNLALVGQSLSTNGIYTRLDNTLEKDYYFIIRNTLPAETIIVEYGYADSNKDIPLLINNWDKYAEAVVKSICEYKNIEYNTSKTLTVYRIKSGDTLESIASKYGTTVKNIEMANSINTDNLIVGSIILVPSGGNKTNTIAYTVKNGDSLYSISNTFKTTINSILQTNNIVSYTIYPGQILTIPLNNILIPYTVINGDSLYKIANKFNTNVSYLKAINNLKNSSIVVGEIILVPES